MSIILKKEHETISFIIVLFAILQKEASHVNIESEGNKVFIHPKKNSEINILKINTKEIENKIFDWINNKDSTKINIIYDNSELALTNEESELLKECAHAAYYFITEKKKNATTQNAFIKFYKIFIKNK